MRQRLAALLALAGFGLLVLLAEIVGPRGATNGDPVRVAFQMDTGTTGSTFFVVGQAIAGLLSHPPGVGRCDVSTVCGPSGTILSVRTSDGAAENLRGVNAGFVQSGFAEGSVILAALKGSGAFRRTGPQTHVRIIAGLFSEQLHLVVAASSNIRNVADLRGKRVLLGGRDSAGAAAAREVLAAWRLREAAIKTVEGDESDAPALLEAGKLDAYFTLVGAPLDSLTHLLREKRARLLPLDGPDRDRLIARVPAFAAATIAANTYPGTGAVDTISTRAFWVVRDSVPDALVYGLTRALFNPANRDGLVQSHPAAREIALAGAADGLPAPLHPGAARFYREANAQ